MYAINSLSKMDSFVKEYNPNQELSKDTLKIGKNKFLVFSDYEDAQNFLRKMREEIILNSPTKRSDIERYRLLMRLKTLNVAYLRIGKE